MLLQAAALCGAFLRPDRTGVSPEPATKSSLPWQGLCIPPRRTREPPVVREGEQPDGPFFVICLTFDSIWKVSFSLLQVMIGIKGVGAHTLTLPTLSPSDCPPFGSWTCDKRRPLTLQGPHELEAFQKHAPHPPSSSHHSVCLPQLFEGLEKEERAGAVGFVCICLPNAP